MADTTVDPWESLSTLTDAFTSAVARSRGDNISAEPLRTAAKRIVQQYFRRTKPYLLSVGCAVERVNKFDSRMQDLLRLANRVSAKSAYRTVLKKAVGAGVQISIEHEQRLGELAALGEAAATYAPLEKRIIATLRELVPAAALSYEQALIDLAATSRFSYRGTANELRESLREVLDHLAPDDKVMKSPGFVLEKNRTTPTQKQKMRYILRSRRVSKAAMRAPEETAALVEELTASVGRSTYERSNLSAHVATAKQEVLQMKMYVETVLAELLEIHRAPQMQMVEEPASRGHG